MSHCAYYGELLAENRGLPAIKVYKMVAPGRRVPLQQATVKRLNSFVSLAATMRHLFICTLLCILPIPALAQTTRSLPQPRQAKSSDLSTNSAQC